MDKVNLVVDAALIIGAIYLYKKVKGDTDSPTVEAIDTAIDRGSKISDNPWMILHYGSIPGLAYEAGKKAGWW